MPKEKKLSEQEKKDKFGDKYDPKYSSRRTPREEGKKDDNRFPRMKGRAPSHNDGTIYLVNDVIGKQTANLPYNTLPGLKYPQDSLAITQTNNVLTLTHNTRNGVIATVMGISYWPSHGYVYGANDSINIAARQLYTFVRHANSGARNYEAPDIMMYILAMADIYAEFFELQRGLGIPKIFSLVNRGLPQDLGTAINLDVDTIASNNADYTAKLNILAAKINSLAVPAYFKIFIRRAFLSSKIFKDSSSVRGQYYLFTKVGRYIWSPRTATTGTELLFNTYTTSNTWMDRYSRLEAALEALLEDEDAAIISGDILKAFGETNLLSIKMTPSDYIPEVVMDEDVLAQIENMVLLNTNIPSGSNLSSIISMMNVTQEEQNISTGIAINLASAPSGVSLNGQEWIQSVNLNSHKEDPDYVDNMEWTRLTTIMAPVDAGSDASPSIYALACGLEIPIAMTMVYSGGQATISSNLLTQTSLSSFNQYVWLAQFDWHPAIYRITTFGSGYAIIPAMDVKVSTWVQASTLRAMHQLANEAVLWDENLYKRAKSPIE